MASKKNQQDQKLVRTYAEAKKCAPDESVLIEVPGEFARQVVYLVNILNDPDNSQAGQLVRQLLQASKPAPE